MLLIMRINAILGKQDVAISLIGIDDRISLRSDIRRKARRHMDRRRRARQARTGLPEGTIDKVTQCPEIGATRSQNGQAGRSMTHDGWSVGILRCNVPNSAVALLPPSSLRFAKSGTHEGSLRHARRASALIAPPISRPHNALRRRDRLNLLQMRLQSR
jgi:hypothetical protein